MDVIGKLLDPSSQVNVDQGWLYLAVELLWTPCASIMHSAPDVELAMNNPATAIWYSSLQSPLGIEHSDKEYTVSFANSVKRKLVGGNEMFINSM